MKMLGSFRIASKWSASNWKNRAGIDGKFPDICFFNSPEVRSLRFATLAFLNGTSCFLRHFLMLFIFCPAKLPLVHACLAIRDLYKPRAGLGKWMSPSAIERQRLERNRFYFCNDPCFCSALLPRSKLVQTQQLGPAEHVCPINLDAGSILT